MFKKITLAAVLVTTAVIGVTSSFNAKSKSDVIELKEGNFIIFSGKVDSESVAKAQVALAEISEKLDEDEVIYLVLDTPGGSVPDGNRFIDFAKSIPQKVKPLVLFAASMGYHMAQSFDERLILPSGTLMSHRASLGGLSGQVPGELETKLAHIKTVLSEMDNVAAKRVGLSVEQYRKLIHDELWLTGADAVRNKHADRIVNVKCSKALVNGRYQAQYDLIFFGKIDVTFSKCPLISGPIALEMAKNNPLLKANVPKAMLKKAVISYKNNPLKLEF